MSHARAIADAVFIEQLGQDATRASRHRVAGRRVDYPTHVNTDLRHGSDEAYAGYGRAGAR